MEQQDRGAGHDYGQAAALMLVMTSAPMPSPANSLGPLIERWKADPGGTYRSWFLQDERLKNFRTIRRGLGAVVR